MGSVGAALGGFSSRQRAVEGQWFNTEGQLAVMRHLEKMVQQVGGQGGGGRAGEAAGLQLPAALPPPRHPPLQPSLPTMPHALNSPLTDP